MMPLSSFMLIGMILFGLSGMLQGWYREFLGTVSIFLAIFVITLAEKYVPYLAQMAADPHQAKTLFFIRVLIFGTLVFFGYQTPRWSVSRRNMGPVRSALLGAVLGVLNGYLIVGTLWHFMDAANYPWPMFIRPPVPDDKLSNEMLRYLPSVFLKVPGIYIVAAIMFVLVIVLFI